MVTPRDKHFSLANNILEKFTPVCRVGAYQISLPHASTREERLDYAAGDFSTGD